VAIRDSLLKATIAEYSADAENLTSKSIKGCTRRAAFRKIFHVAFSFEAVASAVATPRLRPSLSGPRSLALRIPLLVSLGQISAAQAEVRRLLELVAWTIYFTDHRREWFEFSSIASKGFTQNQRTPIAYAAHREANFYLEYLDELMLLDESGLGKRSVEGLKHVHHRLNAVIHPGTLARGTTSPPFDDLDDAKLESFHGLLRDALGNAALLLCAYCKDRYSSMAAGPKAHLLYLLSPQQRGTLSKGDFGLPRLP
jgi:hypothetical protein